MPSIKQLLRVKSGHRVEVVAPEFAEGDLVSVVVEPCGNQPECGRSIVAFLDSLPDGPRALPTWAAYEQYLRQERDAWDR